MIIIDTHVHPYAEDEVRYPPVENPTRPPERTGYISNVERVMKDNGVAKICAIQPGTFYKWDNRFICDLSSAERERMAAVCSLDPEDSSSAVRLKQYVREYGIRGLRSYPSSNGQLDHPGVAELWRACGEANVVLNVFVDKDKTGELTRLLERFSSQPVVIDHCLNLKAGPEMPGVLSEVIRLATFPNTYAKLSFLPGGSAEEYPFRDLHEACHKIISAFGADRCVWGSNFPSELWTPKSTYAQHLRLFTHELNLPEPAKIAILGGTAQRLWF